MNKTSAVAAGHCGKDTLPSEQIALDALRILSKRDRSAGRLASYFCEDCGGWHVGHSSATRGVFRRHRPRR